MEDAPRKKAFEYWSSASRPAEGVAAARRRLASAMRLVIERLVTSDAPEDEIERAAERLEGYAEHLSTHPQTRSVWGFGETSTAGSTLGFFDFSPFIGLSNPLAPPITLKSDGKTAWGEVRFGTAYEGPPGCVHGGFVAAAFDEVLGFAQSMTGSPGMTGTLTIRYRSPTPLHTDLRFTARVDRVEGRKIFASGDLHAGERLCAEAEGIFISVDRKKMENLAEQRAKRLPST